MPSVHARIALTIPPDLRASIGDFAAASGVRPATAIVDLLREMEPQLKHITKIMLLAKAGKSKAAKQALVHMVGDGMAQIISESAKK